MKDAGFGGRWLVVQEVKRGNGEDGEGRVFSMGGEAQGRDRVVAVLGECEV